MPNHADKSTVLALGFFDGVHLGHGALLRRTAEVAAKHGWKSAVMTFDSHPDTLVFGHNVPLISSSADRAYLIRTLYGIDCVEFLRFTKETMCIPWNEFLSLIQKELQVQHFVIGYDFHFGWKGEGDGQKLTLWCAEHGLSCDIIGKVERNGVTISSTYIRELIRDGQMRLAAEFMGHPHLLSDVVRSGHRLGRRLGAPTINMQFDTGVLIPKQGVYATRVKLEDGFYSAVTNIGTRPTVSESGELTVETHILDYSGNLYGRRVILEFLDYIRPEQRFDSLELLSAQIVRDAECSRKAAEEFI